MGKIRPPLLAWAWRRCWKNAPRKGATASAGEGAVSRRTAGHYSSESAHGFGEMKGGVEQSPEVFTRSDAGPDDGRTARVTPPPARRGRRAPPAV